MDKVAKGNVSKAHVIARLMKEGYNLLEPLSENSRYDLAIDLEGRLIRIQIKTIYFKNDKKVYEMVCYSTTRRGKKHIKTPYTEREVDFIIGYNLERDEMYTFPIKDIAGRKQIIFREERRKNQYKPLDIRKYKKVKEIII